MQWTQKPRAERLGRSTPESTRRKLARRTYAHVWDDALIAMAGSYLSAQDRHSVCVTTGTPVGVEP